MLDTYDYLIRGPKLIRCLYCPSKALRIGAEFGLDIYICEGEFAHLVRVRVDNPRTEWKDDDVARENTQ